MIRSRAHRNGLACLMSLSIGVSAWLFAPSAQAATFDDAGNLTPDAKAIVKLSFDSLTDSGGIPLGTGSPLEGAGYALLNSNSPLSVKLTLPKEKKRCVARMFARKNRVVGAITVSYTDSPQPAFGAQFFPTGRVTSDGWYEIETAPFAVDGSVPFEASLELFASGADLDAFELVESGTFKALNRCALKTDAACGAGEYCSAGFCRDGNIQVPKMPEGEAKKQLVRYFGDRLKIFFGGAISRRDNLPRALATISAMDNAKTPWEFWNGFATAVHQLRDWHTRISGPVGTEGRGALPICVVEGDADLSQALAPSTPGLPDVLISHVGPEGNSGLKAGDRIVAVNGQHPVTFAESLDDIDWDYWHSNDPAGHAEGLERLRNLIRRYATDLTVIRCDAATSTCSAPQTIKVTELPTVEPSVYPSCDHRPTYIVPGPDATTHRVGGRVFAAPLTGVDASEGLFGMVWNSVYLDGSSRNPYSAAYDNFRANARGVILDHRQGDGGTELASEYLTSLFRSKQRLGASTGFNFTLGLFGPPFTPQDGLSLLSTVRNKSGNDFDVGSDNARPELKAALLLARDGSASDWFPEGMKGVANVRSFGRRTAGAFSSFLQFDYYGEFNFQFGSGDYLRPDGTGHIGEGVLPDEDILPKQSDLLQGRDTVVLRALEWLRSN
jgi:hypothetical protein